MPVPAAGKWRNPAYGRPRLDGVRASRTPNACASAQEDRKEKTVTWPDNVSRRQAAAAASTLVAANRSRT